MEACNGRHQQEGETSPTPEVPLQNHFTSLQTEEESPITSGETLEPSTAARSAPRKTANTTKKRRRVIAVGDSLPRHSQAPICRPDTLSREVCCLPGACIRDVTKKLPSLVQPTLYCPPLLFHAGTRDTARSSLRSIKKDYRALEVAMRDSTERVVFSSVLQVNGKGFERES